MKTKGPSEGSALQLGLSMSVPSREDLDQHELQDADLHRFAVRVSRVVLDRQGAIVSGHDWRPRGIMKALVEFARRYANAIEDSSHASPRVRNFLAWPDRPLLDENERAGLAHVLSVEGLSLPSWCSRALDGLSNDEATRERIVRMLAFSELRRHLSEQTSARVCIGGKVAGYRGRYPGVVEETALALARNQPVYLLSWAGGATSEVIDLLRSGKVAAFAKRADARVDPRLLAAFDSVKPSIRAYAGKGAPKWLPPGARPWEWSLSSMLKFIYARRTLFATQHNGLSSKENEELWSTASVDVSIDLILRGLSRLGLTGSQHRLAKKVPKPASRRTKKRVVPARPRRR